MEIAANAPASTDVCFIWFLSGAEETRRGSVSSLACEWVGGFLAEDQGSKSTQVSALIFPRNVLLDLWGSSQSPRNLLFQVPNQKSMLSE